MFPALLKEKKTWDHGDCTDILWAYGTQVMLFGLDQVYMTRTFTCSNVLQKTYFTQL